MVVRIIYPYENPISNRTAHYYSNFVFKFYDNDILQDFVNVSFQHFLRRQVPDFPALKSG